MILRPGIRVVRGPQWSGGDNDGGAGHLGTVVAVHERGPGHGKVSVVWDVTGEERMHCAGRNSKYELLIYDNGPAGVYQSARCRACHSSCIGGMRWKCAECVNYDLCTSCYFSDCHRTSHAFLRYTTEDSTIVRVTPRDSSFKQEVYGLVKGTEVVRGPHWNSGDEDGGRGSKGRIEEVEEHALGCFRGRVKVRWQHNPDKLFGYNTGAEGKVQVVALSHTRGGTYYPEHLPELDVITPSETHLQYGDKVIVNVDLETFRKLQCEHSAGWNNRMQQCVEEVGTIVKIVDPDLARVQYEDAHTWTVIRHLLTRLSSFNKGDHVQIIDNYNCFMELQVGHGGWNKKMEEVLGKIGTIIEIDSDGDLKVNIEGRRWVLNPVGCTLHFQPSIPVKKPSMTESTSRPSTTPTIMEKMELFKRDASKSADDIEELMQAASSGEFEKFKAFILKSQSKADSKLKGRAALHVACNKGHTDIINFLLNCGADVNVADDDGNTPLHYAADGEQDSVVEELCKRGADKNVRNTSGQAPLHLAVIQQDLQCVRTLLNSGADVNIQNKDGETPMHIAIDHKVTAIINHLLDCDDLDGSKANNDGFNIIHKAITGGLQSVVEVLIKRDEQLASSPGGPHNFTPLHLAVINGWTAIAGLLVNQVLVDINAQDHEGRTPLHHAVHSCSQTVIDLLMRRGADPNIQDENGNTPAHLVQMPRLTSAALVSSEETLQNEILCKLTECGADLALNNNEGKTPLSLCKAPELKQQLMRILAEVKAGHKEDVPPHWNPMVGTELLVVPLTTSNALTAEEYKNVRYKFLRTMANVEIISIKRIQNRALWTVYNAAKQTMERIYGIGAANERTLFHGTSAKAVEAIQHQNIDPLLAGKKSAAVWGKGAYFAVESKISDNYSTADDWGYRYMFMARVLAGRYAKGERGLKRPPPLDRRQPNALADSVVDSTDSPNIYVVFRHHQIYPEFLIQYR